jgi:nucleoside-diphosphate-sugar epimerase
MINFARFLEFLSIFTHREPFYPLNLVPYVFEDWHVASDKACRELGFAPVSFEEGTRRTLAWYRLIGYEV